MAKQRIWLGDRRMLEAIRKTKDLLPQLESALVVSARNAMNTAIKNAPVDTGALVKSAYVDAVETDLKSKAKNIHLGFRHPFAAFIEEGVIWGKSFKDHGITAPRFLRRATQKHRKLFNAEVLVIVNRWLEKNFKR